MSTPLAGAPKDAPAAVVRLGSRRDGDGLRLQLAFPPGLPWFRGHFPGDPLLPGVVQLKLAIEAARELGPRYHGPRSIQQLKFKSPIRPGATVELRLAVTAGGAAVTFVFASEAGEHSSGRLEYGGA